ncbi:MAG: glutamate--tRNA ligase [Ignavibacteria bacterium]|nr:glutamate--tRNA ligase [Ignavibacteria bacterium]
MISDEIRVRFAPSPTGFLHVGGARTAIFNWLFARKNKGKFLLRIEDTDAERSKSQLSQQIISSMHWLGMNEDEPIVFQALNISRHKEIAMELLKNKKAYYAFETPEELEEQRKTAQQNKIPFKYNRASLNLTEETIQKYLSEGRQYALRFKVPDGITEFDDIVHGKTTFGNSEIEDFVILRSNGSPVYMIAVVVDDHDMKISHIIRGDDHLSNTPKQIMLYNALGWEVPKFAHLPMILDEQKKKLSKRRNPVSADEYKNKGYLPEALFNFLTLLGFAPFNNREVISRQELINEFTFERVNKKSAVFDMKKLNWINSEYIKSADENKLLELVKQSPAAAENNIEPANFSDDYFLQVINIIKERLQTINEIYHYGDYFFKDPIKYDEKGIEKHWNDEIKPIFISYQKLLENCLDWNSDKIEAELRDFANKNNVKAAAIIHLLRLAITGKTVSPGIFDVMVILGKNTVYTRINKFIDFN